MNKITFKYDNLFTKKDSGYFIFNGHKTNYSFKIEPMYSTIYKDGCEYIHNRIELNGGLLMAGDYTEWHKGGTNEFLFSIISEFTDNILYTSIGGHWGNILLKPYFKFPYLSKKYTDVQEDFQFSENKLSYNHAEFGNAENCNMFEISMCLLLWNRN